MKTLTLTLLFISSLLSAQEESLKGNLNYLKGTPEFNLIFDYANLRVGEKTEEEFLAAIIKKRGPEKGQQFQNSWFADREAVFEPKFIMSFNKRFKKGQVIAAKNLTTAKYTMKIKTTWIDPGYNIGQQNREDAEINVLLTVFATENPSNILARYQYSRIPGEGALGFDFNAAYRISEAYAKLAKTIAMHF